MVIGRLNVVPAWPRPWRQSVPIATTDGDDYVRFREEDSVVDTMSLWQCRRAWTLSVSLLSAGLVAALCEIASESGLSLSLTSNLLSSHFSLQGRAFSSDPCGVSNLASILRGRIGQRMQLVSPRQIAQSARTQWFTLPASVWSWKASIRLPTLAASKAFSAGAARVVGEVCSDEDLGEASADVSGLVVGDVAAIMRTDGSWRYATLMKKNGRVLIFDVDPEHDESKEFPRNTWAAMVRRLVKPTPLGVSAEESAMTPVQGRGRRRSSAAARAKTKAQPVCPRTAGAQVSQAAAALRAALDARVTRLQIELVLPTWTPSAESDLDARQQFSVLKSVLKAILREAALKEALGFVDLSTEQALDDSDGVYVLRDSAGEAITIATFPTVDAIDKLIKLDKDVGTRSVLLLVNPQWNVLGNPIPELGFLPGRRLDRYESFIEKFEMAYSFRRLRIKGEQVRLLRVMPEDKWQVFVIPRGGGAERVAAEDIQPSYWDMERLVTGRVGSIASQDWLTRASTEIQKAFEPPQMEPALSAQSTQPYVGALTSKTLPRCPLTVGAMVSQAAAAVKAAVESGITRMAIELILPVPSESDLSDRSQYELLKIVVQSVLKVAVGADLSDEEEWDATEGVYVLRDQTGRSDITVVTFPNADMAERINILDKGAEAKGVLLLANAQWQSAGRESPDLAFLPSSKRNDLEKFLSTFETAYSLRRLRIKGEQVRLQKALAYDPWQVFVVPRNANESAKAELVGIGETDRRPTYWQMESAVSNREHANGPALQDWFTRARSELTGALFTAPPEQLRLPYPAGNGLVTAGSRPRSEDPWPPSGQDLATSSASPARAKIVALLRERQEEIRARADGVDENGNPRPKRKRGRPPLPRK